ncbi:puromycin-sensitive aminopeptidase-like protein, partial [Dinothrombium tinctorium]
SSDGELKIEFTGVLNDEFDGFSRVFFDDIQRYGAVTNFEPESARKAFPCFEDPSPKATFQISVIVLQEMTALSNMSIASSEPYNENISLKKVSFEKTPPLSTYLAALVIGYYDYVERMHGEKPIRVYTYRGKTEQI